MSGIKFNPKAALDSSQVTDRRRRKKGLSAALGSSPRKGDILQQMARGKYRGPIYKGTRAQARAGAQKLLHNRFGR